MTDGSVIDKAPIAGFHRKLRLQCAGGTFLDGYLLSSMAVAIPGVTDEFSLSPVALSVMAAAALVGIFGGSLIFGWLSDRVGRHTLFTVDLAVFAVAALMTFFVTDAWQLIVLRLIVGLAVGADYPLAMAMVTEWMPTKYRAGGIATLVMSWFGGAVTAYIVGYFIVAGAGDDAWRWVLGSATVPAVITLLLRVGMPESPRWLLAKGRADEALDVLRNVFGSTATLDGLTAGADTDPQGRISELFSRRYIRRTAFAAGPYTAQTTAFFVILTFEPTILLSFGLDHGNISYLGSALTSLLFLLGCLPVLRWAETVGRRRLYIWSFALMTLPLLVLGLVPIEAAALVVASFCFYAFVSGPTNVLSWSYPNELFPTHIRATAVGFATAMTRVGATAGTFLLPILLESIGTRPTMLVGAAVVASGLVMCVLWAPETSGKPLEEASAVPAPGAARTPSRLS
ncbi:MFS transporter [Mycolicibacterium goodii]|uniref:MFS transporter n=1 Tax=Mycolicibacterium TaxID=1866885 RepID=UPI0018EED0D8|nr:MULTISPECIES: MFS transporter [Mycolicibacterium]ULN48258.1 MFS transporter [Mycolicibacterium goodii]